MIRDCGTHFPPKQLSMIILDTDIIRLPDTNIPNMYDLRSYRRGDESSWADTLRLGGFTDWNVERVLQYLEEPERMKGSSVVAYEGEVIAATFASRTTNRSPSDVADNMINEYQGLCGDQSLEGVVDYVVTRPIHQGQGLGRATTMSVTKFLADRGCKIVSLTTDDWRLPAIRLYLSIGFRPMMNRKDMPSRWQKVLNKLKESGFEYP